MTQEEMELTTVEIIAYAGDARSKYIEAMEQFLAPLLGNVKNLSCKNYPNDCQRFPFLFIGCFSLAYFFCRGLPLLSGRMGTTLFSMRRRIFLNK